VLTALWQAEDFREREWLDELFGDHIDRHIYDGHNKVVLDHCILIDKFIHRKPIQYYEQFSKRTNVFLFHMSDEQYHGGYEAYRHFNGVFRNYWSSVFKDQVMILPLGYSNGVSSCLSRKPASTRKYAWSFAGETRRASRPEMVEALKGVDAHLCHSTDSGEAESIPPSAYRGILEDTIFAPSPMGRLNLECFRLYEALECGCIPIVEKRASLDYFTDLLGPHPLISIGDWSQAAALVKEWQSDLKRIDALQSEITRWWQTKKRLLKTEISAMLSDNSSTKRITNPTRLPYKVPFWQLQELCRHQSPRGLVRRLKIQAQRVR
jgi:hypothetical protein